MEKLRKFLNLRTALPCRNTSLILVSKRCISQDAQSNFPYIFRNRHSLVQKRESTKDESVEIMHRFLNDEIYRLQDGFSMAYLAFLKSIEQNDLSTLGSFCEKNLYQAMAEGLQ